MGECAKQCLPDLVQARIRRNCRQAPRLVAESEAIVGRPFGFTFHRLAQAAAGSAERITVTAGNEPAMLAGALKLLVSQYSADDIVVLSPWGARSVASRVMGDEADGPEHASDRRWLRAHLGEGPGRVRFGSISKLKGIEADAVVITDVSLAAQEWADSHDFDWDDTLYVALSRARFRAVILESD